MGKSFYSFMAAYTFLTSVALALLFVSGFAVRGVLRDAGVTDEYACGLGLLAAPLTLSLEMFIAHVYVMVRRKTKP